MGPRVVPDAETDANPGAISGLGLFFAGILVVLVLADHLTRGLPP